MDKTSISLLERLRSSPESEGWARLVKLYAPLIKTWLKKYDVQDSDAEDLTQEILIAVMKDVGKFDHAGHRGAFRAWLKGILANRLRAFWRNRNRLPEANGGSDIDERLIQLEDPHSEMSRLWNRQHDQFVLRQILALVQPYFSPATWQAFVLVALKGQRADAVAKELEISTNAVFIAKSRVLKRLRQEADGMVESSLDFSPPG